MTPASTDNEFKQSGAYVGLLSREGGKGYMDDRGNYVGITTEINSFFPGTRQADQSQSQPGFSGLGFKRSLFKAVSGL